MTLTSRPMDPALTLNKMLIRRRIEKLESFSQPTIENLVGRIEREAMNALSREEQRLLSGRSDGVEKPAMERYQEALSSALKQVSDDDLDRMILFYEPNTSRVESQA